VRVPRPKVDEMRGAPWRGPLRGSVGHEARNTATVCAVYMSLSSPSRTSSARSRKSYSWRGRATHFWRTSASAWSARWRGVACACVPRPWPSTIATSGPENSIGHYCLIPFATIPRQELRTQYCVHFLRWSSVAPVVGLPIELRMTRSAARAARLAAGESPSPKANDSPPMPIKTASGARP
jgi:hypothetical protein